MKSLKVEQMLVSIYESEAAMGKAAAQNFARVVSQAVAARGEAAVIMATGNSQLAFVAALQATPNIPWERVTVFHMDEYLNLPETHSASFRRFIREKIERVFQPKATHLLQGDAFDIHAEVERYSALLEAHPPDLCVLGIGENGHLAFNDPPADFTTDARVHVVTLDAICRQQQVGEGHFQRIEDVPQQAITLTVPALLEAARVMAIVPEARKAAIVKAALYGPVSEACPASILRTQSHTKLYLDGASAALM